MVITRNTNDTINTTVYRKPTNTDIYINWHSHSPLQWKKTTAKVLIQRAITICSDKILLHEKQDMNKYDLYGVNKYPRKSVQNIINDNLHKRNSITPNLNKGNNSKKIFSSLKRQKRK